MFKSHASSLLDRLPNTHGRFHLPAYVLDALSSGDIVQDFEFDQILPPRFRAISDEHWSSVEAAYAIIQMIKDSSVKTFVDLGAGPGKLSLLLALMSDLEITAIERRRNLVEIGRKICEANAPERVRFIHGDLFDLDWGAFDVLYLFNPFLEHTCGPLEVIDQNIALGRKSYNKSVGSAFRHLCLLNSGQRVITFHGYGGRMPDSLKLVRSARVGAGTMKMWEQSSREKA